MDIGLARSDEHELLDEPELHGRHLPGTLADLRRINRFLGGTRLTLAALDSLVGDRPPDRSLAVLDVGTGGGDIPVAVARWAERRGRPIRIVATDVSPEILQIASATTQPGVEFALADARRLPFPDDSFDIALCSLLVHHFTPDEAVTVLSEMRRVSRIGIVVNDLVRGRLGSGGAWAVGHLLTANPITRHDAPASARRAYTREDLCELGQLAGLRDLRLRGWLGYRVAMTGGPGS